MTSSAAMVARIDQPTTRRENRSITTATGLGRPDVGEVGDPLSVRCARRELPVQNVRRHRVLPARPDQPAALGAAIGHAAPVRASAARYDAARSRRHRPANPARPAGRDRFGRCRRSWPISSEPALRHCACGRSAGGSATHGTHCARHRAPRKATAPARSLDASPRSRTSYQLSREVAGGAFLGYRAPPAAWRLRAAADRSPVAPA